MSMGIRKERKAKGTERRVATGGLLVLSQHHGHWNGRARDRRETKRDKERQWLPPAPALESVSDTHEWVSVRETVVFSLCE